MIDKTLSFVFLYFFCYFISIKKCFFWYCSNNYNFWSWISGNACSKLFSLPLRASTVKLSLLGVSCIFLKLLVQWKWGQLSKTRFSLDSQNLYPNWVPSIRLQVSNVIDKTLSVLLMAEKCYLCYFLSIVNCLFLILHNNFTQVKRSLILFEPYKIYYCYISLLNVVLRVSI